MEFVNMESRESIAFLFDGWEETLIWSCLQGLMGNAWADRMDAPESAQIVVGDFCYFAGKPDKELVKNIPSGYASKSMIMVPKTEDWNEVIEREWGEKCCRRRRYAIKKEGDIFDRQLLERNVEQLPKQYSLKMMDEEAYKDAMAAEWSRDFCAHFKNYDDYAAHGIGCAIYYGEELVAGASSYTYYDKGIEVEIGTKEEHQRKGLARVTASKLILECLKRGKYPSWDARVKESARLAEQLGYHYSHEYGVYIVMLS